MSCLKLCIMIIVAQNYFFNTNESHYPCPSPSPQLPRIMGIYRRWGDNTYFFKSKFVARKLFFPVQL